MKIKIELECECGNKLYIPLKRTINKLVESGRIYEDYSSITDSFNGNESFSVKQTVPEEVTFTCKVCGTSHELST
ncbi:hypothetical protein SMD22_00810 (plasmid) [Brevibacillus halotolerans]|nr:hypothetical protein SMD22_00810 [Brevibacillus halotolerans]